MKRIALLGFIILIVPVIFSACNSCSQSLKDYPKFRTYSKIENQIFKNNMSGFHQENDTVMEDTIKVLIGLQAEHFSLNKNSNPYNPYSSIACSPADPKEKNPIKNFLFGVSTNANASNFDTTLLKSLVLKINGFKWPKEKDMFFADFNQQELPHIFVNVLSPHNSAYIQFVTWAIKENGDTLKAISQKVFCK